MADNQIPIEISLETDKAEKNLAGLSSHFDALAKTAATVGSAALVGIGVAVTAITALGVAYASTAKEASEGQKAVSELNFALKSTGDFTDKSSAQFQALADTIQKTTKFTDEAALASVAMAKQFDLTNSETETLVKAATELATVTGTDLTTATNTLLQSYEGNVRALGKQIPAVKDLTAAQLANGDAVKLISDRLKGAAASSAETFSGKISILEKTFGDLQKEIGKTIIQNPVLLKIIDETGKVFESLTGIVAENKQGIADIVNGFIVLVASGVSPAIKSLQFLFNVVAGLANIFIQLYTTETELIAAFGEFLVSISGVKEGIQSVIHFLLAMASAAISVVGEFIKIISIVPGADKILAGFGTSAEELGKRFDSAQKSIEGLADSVTLDAIASAPKKLGDGARAVGDGFISGIQTINDGFDSVASKAGSVAGKLKTVADTQKLIAKDGTEAVKNQIQAYEKLTQVQAKAIVDFKKNNPISLLFPDPNTDPITQYLVKGQKKLQDLIKQRDEIIATGVADQEQRFQDLNKAIDKTKANILDAKAAAGVGIAAGLTETIAQGAQGAIKIVSSTLGSIADTLLPGIGGAVSSIVGILAQGPDKVRDFVIQFTNALPTVIGNIIKSIPVLLNGLIKGVINAVLELILQLPDILLGLISGLGDLITNLLSEIPNIIGILIERVPYVIQALIDGIPRIITDFINKIPQIIQGFIAKIPDLINALTVEMPKVAQNLATEMPKIAQQLAISLIAKMPEIAAGMIKGMIDNIPAFFNDFKDKFLKIPGEFLNALVQGLKDALKGILDVGGGIVKGAGDVIGSVTGAIGGLLGFAQGGLVPQGYPNDSFPARLTSGEFIIDRSLTDKLNRYIDQNSLPNQGGDTRTIVESSSARDSGSRNLTINLVVGEKQLAQVMLDLNRQGFRTA